MKLLSDQIFSDPQQRWFCKTILNSLLHHTPNLRTLTDTLVYHPPPFPSGAIRVIQKHDHTELGETIFFPMLERVLSTLGIFLLLSSNYVLGFGEEGPPCIDVANKRIRIGDNMGVANPWGLAVAAKYVEQLTGWDITWQRIYGGERSGKERSDELTMLLCEQNSCVLRFFSSRLLRSPQEDTPFVCLTRASFA